MTEKLELIKALKQQLKAQGKTYADVARYMGLSEASVKRLLAKGDLSLTRLEQLCHMINIQISDLFIAMQSQKRMVSQLTPEQEQELVKDVKLLLVAACVVNHWSFDDILDNYAISYHDVIQRLVHLDRLGIVELFPNNRYKLRIARNFSWIPKGPIHQYFKQHAQADFLASDFERKTEFITLQFGMLAEESNLKLQKKCQSLVKSLTQQHIEDIGVPIAEKKAVTLVVAMRPWLPPMFDEFKKVK